MKSISTLLVSAVLLFLCSCNSNPEVSSPAGENNDSEANLTPLGQASVVDDESMKNILNIAIGSPDHTTLVAGVQAAGIEHILVNAGPLTVFAPTNEAFDALPPGTLDELLLPENKRKLGDIITFHATPGKLYLKDLKDGMSVYMATNEYVKVEVREDGTYVHGSKILGTIVASNGIVHVVDKVMLPTQL
jgi:uncharacterized surface protein with fasciclin (FAS1) repeats